ncbi:uncharacterized protein sb:cb288 isoform X2 [Scyliorhinus canicula]|nr:uncharacterized protein sb:cb288 isoform X2 [Scyliorhinus canicula]
MARNRLHKDQRLMPVHSSTNQSSPNRHSGIVPGILVASIFIAILLGLYTILWQCMNLKVKRPKGNGRSKQKVRHSGPFLC